MTANSSPSTAAPKAPDPKPPKPHADFPLYAHALGYWSKKIRGTIYHFGRWGRVRDGVVTRDDPANDGAAAALLEFDRRKEDLYAGRVPPKVKVVTNAAAPDDGPMTVKELVNEFLTAKYHRLTRGKLTPRSFSELKETCDRLANVFGKGRPIDDLGPRDFTRLMNSLPETWGPVRTGNEVGRVKSVFAYAFENGHVKVPFRFGSEFKRPDKEEVRKAKRGEKLFAPEEVRRLLAVADPTARAMVLLGINCAFGNNDVATLPAATDPDRGIVVDLDRGWLSYRRPKTGIERRAALWPETVEALAAVRAARPKPTAKGAERFFVTDRGRPFLAGSTTTKLDSGATVVSETAHPVTRLFGDLLKAAGIKPAGRGFYALRHTFRTVADAVPDRNAIDLVMGHANHTMGGNYTHGVADARLRAVCDHVRAWLFPTSPAPAKEGGAA